MRYTLDLSILSIGINQFFILYFKKICSQVFAAASALAFLLFSFSPNPTIFFFAAMHFYKKLYQLFKDYIKEVK